MFEYGFKSFNRPLVILEKIKENLIKENNNQDNNKQEIFDVNYVYNEYHDETLEGKEYNIIEELDKLPTIVLIRMGAVYNEFIKNFFMGLDDLYYHEYVDNFSLSQINKLSTLGNTDRICQTKGDILESDEYYFYNDKVYDIYLENLADALRFYVRISMLYNKRFKLRTIVSMLVDELHTDFKYHDIYTGTYTLSNILRSFILDWYERLVYPIVQDIQVDSDLPLASRIKYRNAITNIISYFENRYDVENMNNDELSTLVVYTLYGFYNTPYIKENKSLNEILKIMVFNHNKINDFIYKDLDSTEYESCNGDVKDFLFKGRVFKDSISPHVIYVYLSYIAKLYFEEHQDIDDDEMPLVIKESHNWK